jgi:hypothetical protein
VYGEEIDEEDKDEDLEDESDYDDCDNEDEHGSFRINAKLNGESLSF